ncbi:hypothetical protein BRC94_10605 [Halobacteriales archaeon QS_5_70_17]|nr:MAG: hypothetical protein BRC94_10605 [Halobacteriales archaeon QS_5_70_17]
MALLSMTWRDVLFAHWPVDPDLVRPRLPPGLDVDARDGRAWLGVVAFVMEDLRPAGLPVGLSFLELNLRTYVDGPVGPGIYFFNLDADHRLAVPVARRAFRLPYYRAEMAVDRDGLDVSFRSRRIHRGAPSLRFDATYGPADGDVENEDLAEFLTERYRFYVGGGDRGPYVGEVAHDPWPLRPGRVDVRRNDCFRANAFDRPDGAPLVHYSPTLDVRAERLGRS